MPPSPRWRLPPELPGAFLAGAGLGWLGAARLEALSAPLLGAAALASGGIATLPWLLVGLARGLAHRPPPWDGLRGALRGALVTVVLVVLSDLALFAALRRLAVAGALIAAEGAARSLALSGLCALATLGLGVGGGYLLKRVPPAAHGGRWALAAGIGLIALTLAAGRSQEGAPSPSAALTPSGSGDPPRLLVIGLDAVGFEIFQRYRGVMPHLAAFAEASARGRLVPAPPYLSPAVWTSIATGLPTSEHHVANYELYADLSGVAAIPIDRFYTDPATSLGILPAVLAWRAGWLSVLPTTRLHRRGQPFWQAAGASVGVVCWPATWPAEPVRGWMISDRWPPDRAETLFHYRTDLPEQVWPSDLQATLSPLRRSPAEPPDPEVLAMAPFTAGEVDAFHAALREELAAPADQPFSNLHYAWLNDRSCLAAARRMVEVQRPEMAAVYLLGPDLVGHAFLPDPSGRVAGFGETDARRLAAVYPAYLHRLDQDLAWLLAAAGPATRTVLLTDHGMVHEGTDLFSVWHADDGLVLVQGPGFTPGQDLGRRPAEAWRHLLAMPAPGAHDTSPE